jgi:hypothetical protein
VKAKVPEPPYAKCSSVATELMKRKKVLKGLENKRTREIQTVGSHFRRE